MELEESLEETAKRELNEETGLSAKVFEFIDVFSGKDLYYQYSWRRSLQCYRTIKGQRRYWKT
ncbi:NUDIX domain-containing protein [Bacillus spizizenii]|uniref:NUDIX domain-containing protein n=1 Tax=Bacillus spizizenii TaxID=96241 RepID=UPI00092E923E|nr:NUDIX domain-containing protein [Bacillus spizizenii]